jgi:putative transposase
MIMQEAEKEQFVRYMRLYERLCGVRVLTHCVMGNHFHLLVEVPRRPAVLPTEVELVKLVGETLGGDASQALKSQFERWRQQDDLGAIAQEMDRWYAQMWDLGRFMKVLKQRFSQWYNGRQPVRRTGTLWEGRYRSVVVESGEALRAMALYIDLNPVRAGLVEDPKDYRWCGFGEAVAGQCHAQARLARVAELSSPALANRSEKEPEWIASMVCWYRESLYGRGEERRDAEGRVTRIGFSPQEVQRVLEARGALPLHVYLRLRVRYLTHGAVLGSKAFVESVFRERRGWFSAKRRTGARRLKGLEKDCPLRTARALRIRPFG